MNPVTREDSKVRDPYDERTMGLSLCSVGTLARLCEDVFESLATWTDDGFSCD